MILRHPRSTRSATLCPYATLFRADERLRGSGFGNREAEIDARPTSGGGRSAGRTCARCRSAWGKIRDREIARDSVLETKARRSEEHTSELQSLMRSSYAVFCLKQNNERLNSR